MSMPPLRRLTGHDAVSMTGVVRSEWLKLLTCTSLRALLIVTGGAQIALTLAGLVLVNTLGAEEAVGNEVITTGLRNGPLLVLLYAVVGIVVASSDFSSGVINSSFLAQGSRRRMLIAKAVVTAGCVAVTCLCATLVTITLCGAYVTLASSVTFPFTEAAAWFGLLAMPLAAACSALIGLGIGLAVRSTLASLLIVLAIYLFVPVALSLILFASGNPTSWINEVAPAGALGAIMTLPSRTLELPWWATALVGVGWAGVSMGVGSAIFAARPLGAGKR